MVEVVDDPDIPTSMKDFWQLSRAAWSTAQHLVDENVQGLQHADMDQLRYVLTQYRWFTHYYSGDLAILIYKLPPSSLRSFLAECLLEEQGMGDPTQTHPAMYDRFLLSIGVPANQLETTLDGRNLALLESFRSKLLSGSYMYGVGLRGMGAECLCQVYLEAVHHYLLKNEEISSRRREIDWTFWDIHASEADQMHGEKTRDLIERLATSPEKIRSLTLGYLEAERMFLEFWLNAYRGADTAERNTRSWSGAIPADGWRLDPSR
jgi:Iron-containing redox enzyme